MSSSAEVKKILDSTPSSHFSQKYIPVKLKTNVKSKSVNFCKAVEGSILIVFLLGMIVFLLSQSASNLIKIFSQSIYYRTQATNDNSWQLWESPPGRLPGKDVVKPTKTVTAVSEVTVCSGQETFISGWTARIIQSFRAFHKSFVSSSPGSLCYLVCHCPRHGGFWGARAQCISHFKQINSVLVAPG